MQLEDAQVLADIVRHALEPFCERVAAAGSIRRLKAEVNDVDIVALPKVVSQPGPLGGTVKFSETDVFRFLLPKAVKKVGFTCEACGQELLRFNRLEDGFQVDVYRARAETWGVILLVRTGSKEHNVKLCSLARSKWLKLSACEGVVTQEGFGRIVASRTEEEVFAALGLGFVEPKDREVF